MNARPAASEYDPYFSTYVELAPDGDIVDLLEQQRARLVDVGRAARPGFAYADGKWTSEEVIGHIVDIERVFTYRAMCFSRGLVGVELAGVDQDVMVPASRATARGIESLVTELDHLRRSGVALFRSFDADHLAARGRASGMGLTVRALLYLVWGHAQHHADVLAERYHSPGSGAAGGPAAPYPRPA